MFDRTTAFIFIITSLLTAQIGSSGATTEQLINELGSGHGDIERVRALSDEPARAVELLIRQLHPVSAARVTADQRDFDTEHVLWAIRALRFLTGGKDFCAPTRYQFGTSEEEKNRKYWLTFGGRTCIPFFAMWPSRGSDYIAPRDAQLKIITNWKKWYAAHGRTYAYSPLRNPQPHQWLW